MSAFSFVWICFENLSFNVYYWKWGSTKNIKRIYSIIIRNFYGNYYFILELCSFIEAIGQSAMDMKEIAKVEQKTFMDIQRRRQVNKKSFNAQDYRKIKFNT